MYRLIFLFLLLLTACAGSPDKAPVTVTVPAAAASVTAATATAPAAAAPVTTAGLSITSPAFAQDTAIPAKYTCQGEDIAPALEWADPPQGTKSLALILDDPDAPGGIWVHWVVYNLPADTRGLPESASQGKSTQANLPAGTQQGKNSFNRVNYGGPCPPSGEHHYRFHLYALDTTLTGEALNKTALLKVMDGHILGQGELVGLYQKQ